MSSKMILGGLLSGFGSAGVQQIQNKREDEKSQAAQMREEHMMALREQYADRCYERGLEDAADVRTGNREYQKGLLDKSNIRADEIRASKESREDEIRAEKYSRQDIATGKDEDKANLEYLTDQYNSQMTGNQETGVEQDVKGAETLRPKINELREKVGLPPLEQFYFTDEQTEKLFLEMDNHEERRLELQEVKKEDKKLYKKLKAKHPNWFKKEKDIKSTDEESSKSKVLFPSQITGQHPAKHTGYDPFKAAAGYLGGKAISAKEKALELYGPIKSRTKSSDFRDYK